MFELIFFSEELVWRSIRGLTANYKIKVTFEITCIMKLSVAVNIDSTGYVTRAYNCLRITCTLIQI